MKKKTKLIWGGIFIALVAIALGTYSLREPILIEAGNFMAPTGNYSADVVILEGAEFIRTGFIEYGQELLAQGKVKRIVVVIQNIAPAHRPFGINGNYPDIVRQKLKDLGLKEEQFKVVVVSIRHPVTLKEAQSALKQLAADNVKSAILVAPGFHTRRSYLAYQYVGEPLQIKIYSQACFTDYKIDKWWTSEAGWRDFGSEFSKLIYYLAGRHIPFKFSY